MSAKKIDIINQLKTLYTFRKLILEDKIHDLKNKKADVRAVDDDICKLEDEFRDQKGITLGKTLLVQLPTKNNSKKLKDSKQITKQVYNMLNKSITYK